MRKSVADYEIDPNIPGQAIALRISTDLLGTSHKAPSLRKESAKGTLLTHRRASTSGQWLSNRVEPVDLLPLLLFFSAAPAEVPDGTKTACAIHSLHRNEDLAHFYFKAVFTASAIAIQYFSVISGEGPSTMTRH